MEIQNVKIKFIFFRNVSFFKYFVIAMYTDWNWFHHGCPVTEVASDSNKRLEGKNFTEAL